LAGGTDLTIVGTGFGSDTAALRINVGSASCAVTSITDVALYCRIEPLSSGLAEPPVAIGTMKSTPGERGARWQWATGKHVLLPSFATPVDWTEAGTTTFIDGWFEAPVDGEVTFMLRQDAVSKLYWSGSDIANRTTTLASVTSVAEHLRKAVKVEKWTTAIQPWRSSSDYNNFIYGTTLLCRSWSTLCEGDVHFRPDSAPDTGRLIRPSRASRERQFFSRASRESSRHMRQARTSFTSLRVCSPITASSSMKCKSSERAHMLEIINWNHGEMP
jgi:hypothetical protein